MWERIKLNENIKYSSFFSCTRYTCFTKEPPLGWRNRGCAGGKGTPLLSIANRIRIISSSCGANEASVWNGPVRNLRNVFSVLYTLIFYPSKGLPWLYNEPVKAVEIIKRGYNQWGLLNVKLEVSQHLHKWILKVIPYVGFAILQWGVNDQTRLG